MTEKTVPRTNHPSATLPPGMGLAGATIIALLLTALTITACNLLEQATLSTTTATPPPPTPSPQATVPAVSPTPTQPVSTTLVLWTTESYSPTAEIPAGEVLAQQLSAFEETYPDVHIEVVLKKPYGEGGILDFLMTSSQVAPSILPDLVILDTVELEKAGRAGLVRPLDALISPELKADLFPCALQAGTVGEQLMGVQFEADIEHLAYNLAKLDEPPLTWTEVLTLGLTYIFPAAGRNGLVNNAFLSQYYGAGGQLFDETGHLALDQAILAEVLSFYQDGANMGVIPPEVLEYKSAADCWPIYLSAQVALTNVDSFRYLRDRGILLSTGFAPIPTRTGKAVTISQGWTLAIVTQDTYRQTVAASLLEWLLTPANNAAWNQAAHHLPTRRSAFEYLDEEDEYMSFAYQQLTRARPYPSEPEYEQVSRALQQAVQDVLSGQATPDAAAAAVMEAVAP